MHYILQPYNYNLSDPESIPNLFLKHLSLVLIIMLISLIIAIPLGLLVARYKRFYLPLITASGLLYCIPSIAAFALLLPITGLSPATAIIPLVLYNQLALIRNTAAGINGIDPLLLEVGRAMGMNRWQILLRVTLPLALPVIVAGLRVAMVTSIGIATLATLCGTSSLGDLIFLGIENTQNDQVLAGAILISLLAILADLLLLAIQVGLNRGRPAISVA